MKSIDPKPAQQDADIDDDPFLEDGSWPSDEPKNDDEDDDWSLDIETEDNWIGMLRGIGVSVKEINYER